MSNLQEWACLIVGVAVLGGCDARAGETRNVDLSSALSVEVGPPGADLSVPVRVTNTPLPVAMTGLQPFQRQFALDWGDGSDLATATYQVPVGKRLVIEYASLSAFLQPGGQSMFVRIVTTVGGSDAFHTLAVQRREDYGVLPQFGAAHLVRIYADPGSTVRVSAGRVPFAGTANCAVTVSGRLENAP